MSIEARREIGEVLLSQPFGDEDDTLVLIEQRDQARGMVVELEGENALLMCERDAALLRAERAES